MAQHGMLLTDAWRRLRGAVLVTGTSAALLIAAVPHGAAATTSVNTAGQTARVSASAGWTVKSVDNMHASRDFVCWQQSSSFMVSIARAERAANANVATVDTPYDPASNYHQCTNPANPIAYEAAWVQALRGQGLHVWFRQNWFNWEGGYGAPKLTASTTPAIRLGTAAAVLNGSDTTSYLALTYHFILDHPGLYASGDIFTPESEPQNGGVRLSHGTCSGPCQFGDWPTLNTWLRDSMTVDSAAFTRLGLHVTVGYWGLQCSNNQYKGQNNIEASTIRQMGVYAADCYFQDVPTLTAHLAQLHLDYNVDVVVGEFGDIWDGGAQPTTSTEVTTIATSASSLGYVSGFNYWQAYGGSGGEGLVDKQTLQLNATGLAMAHIFN
jgi:hypothetical protein